MVRLEKRRQPSAVFAWATPVMAVVATMIFGGLLFAALGKDPLVAIRTIFWDPLFGQYAFFYRPQLLVKGGPLILIAIGLSLGFRAGIWNIGAEGQLHMGAFAATYVVLTGWEGSAWTMIPTMMLAGMVAGGVWALIPALLKVKLKVNEIITTLLMNYVAILWVDYLVYGPWKDPGTLNFPLTKQFPGKIT